MSTDLDQTIERKVKTRTVLSSVYKLLDNPSSVSRILRLKEYLEKVESFQNNAEDGKECLIVTESIDNDLFDTMTWVYSILIPISNDTFGEDERKVLTDQMQKL